MTNRQTKFFGAILALAATSLPLAARANAAPPTPCRADSSFISLETELPFDPADSAPLLSLERSGAVSIKQGQHLRVNADPGNVHIFTDETAQVSYQVRVEADSREPGAREFLDQFQLNARRIPGGVSLDGSLQWQKFGGRFRLVYEIHVPKGSNVEVHTLGGNIELQDLDGIADLSTEGGDIKAGRVGAAPASAAASAKFAANHLAAKLETMGGHIAIGDVAGTLRATTSGGHITTGNISGDAFLHTDGGMIRAGRISGAAMLETGGGNIHVQSASSNVTADTAGGEIQFGETSGTIRARTQGGSVRIAHVTGPTTVETSGGIFLGQVDAPLRVSSTSGGVTARLAGSSGRAAPVAARNGKNSRILPLETSQLSATGGDIVVYIPREMAATIDAVIEQSEGHRIIADASLPLQVSYQDSSVGPHSIHCAGELNGGGEVFHLRAVSGNIILKSDEPGMQASTAPRERHGEHERNDGPTMLATASAIQQEGEYDAAGFFAEIRRRIAESWWGGVPVDAEEMQQRLEHSVAPAYPDVARKAGIEGDVVLRVSIAEDGRVTNLEVLDGPPVLARAAVNAVQQWQYRPVIMSGRPAAAVTTLVVSFRLH